MTTKDQHPAEAPVAWYVFADTEHWATLDENEAWSNRVSGFQVRPLIFQDSMRQDSLRHDPEVAALRAAYNEAIALKGKAFAEVDALRAEVEAKQARIDALMFEYCPDEMTPEQIEEWARHQKRVPESEEAELRAALEGSNG